MTIRNLSPQQMFIHLAQAHTPLYTFKNAGQRNFSAWKSETLPKVLATLGDAPPKVPLFKKYLN